MTPPKPDPGEIDYRRKAELMHRRAQRAEADLMRVGQKLAETTTHARSLWMRESGMLNELHAATVELSRLRLALPDPLARIIALGKEYP